MVLSSYHGGSLNGKVITNASCIFDSLAIIFKGEKSPNCMLSDANIDSLCLQFNNGKVDSYDGAKADVGGKFVSSCDGPKLQQRQSDIMILCYRM